MNREIRKLRQSFECAFRGVLSCLRTERNFRIHITAAVYVSIFALLGGLDAVRCAILCLCFSGMMSAELMNTAIERSCDRQALGYDKLVREAKDIAAAGVVVCALFCVLVGSLFFLWEGALWTAARFFAAHLWAAGLLAVSIPAALLFVFRFR